MNKINEYNYNAVTCAFCQADTHHTRVGYNEIGLAILECARCHHRWYYNEKLDAMHLKVDGQ